MATLANWSKDEGSHAHFMSWVWIGPGGVVVDVFLPDDDQLVNAVAKDWMTEIGGETWVMPVPRPRERADAFDLPDTEDLLNEPLGFLEPSLPPVRARTRIEEAVELADDWADSAMDRLFERSPTTLGTVAGVPVRGEWIRGDRIGPATHEVLVGVLAEGLPVDHRARRRHRDPAPAGWMPSWTDGC
ncbi:hypothetical protein [Kitasatospora sp. NPDC057015]|uniref:hypothetical protein n=1 Tax=Kitasatospora sp. NPDC057015 TaxID=3346001 RepID=UPI00363B393A